jgi:hypothetical protein
MQHNQIEFRAEFTIEKGKNRRVQETSAGNEQSGIS